MRILFVLFYLTSCSFLHAQNAVLSFIDEDKKEFFRNNGWELFYSSDNIKFYDYVIQNGNLVIAESVGDDYNIHFLNEHRLIEKSKSINGNNRLPGLPKLYIDKGNIAFAPMQKFECRIIPEKEKVKKKGRLKNWKKRRQGEVFKKYFHYKFFTFYSFASLNKENGYQKVEIHFGLDEKNLTTLYVTKIKSDMLTYSNNAERLEVEFLDNQVFLMDNFNNKFLVFDLGGNKLSEIDLSDLNDRFGLLGGALLRKDQVMNKLYLISPNKIYQINSSGEDFQFENMKLNSDFSFYKSRIYNNYLYSQFYMKQGSGRAIYRKKLK